uniref:Uncharacterized protein n=1 Tax=Anguilla anguilla TaxID=7936 RepID=A0A0E9VZS8_ANGAN
MAEQTEGTLRVRQQQFCVKAFHRFNLPTHRMHERDW